MDAERHGRFTTFAAGRRKPDDEFFQPGNRQCGIVLREGVIVNNPIEEVENASASSVQGVFGCSIPGCNWIFSSTKEFEMHYNSNHRFVCSECRKPLPSPHLLDLHLSEIHDSYFKAKAEREPAYQCFIESCPSMSKNPTERRNHCITVHKFPPDFRFDTFRKPVKKCGTISDQLKNLSVADDRLEDTGSNGAKGNSNTVNPMAKRNLTFGHLSANDRMFVRSLTVPPGYQKQKKEKIKYKDVSKQLPVTTISVTELMDTLPQPN